MSNYSIREVILDVLIRIEKDQAFSHILIDQTIKSGKVKKQDEGLLTEMVYGTVKRKMTLDYYLASFVNQKKKLDRWVELLLHMSIYQMVYLDKVPDHAIIHEAVEIAKRRGHKGVASFVNGVLRNVQRKGVPNLEEIPNPIKQIAIETSHPEWLVKKWTKMYGMEKTHAICMADLAHKPISVRVQPLKVSRDLAMKKLMDEGLIVKPSTFSMQGIIIEQGNILHSKLYQSGCLTIQDQTSMLVGEILDAKMGMTVLDACSAPGGKTTHIAEKMENNGQVLAYDLHKKKADLVAKKARELDLSIIQACEGDARKLQTLHQNETFDRILLDVPCSGLGVIRGKPEIKYTKNEQNINQLGTIQSTILDHVEPLLKKDGMMVYSTCTINKEENEEIVKQFLRKHPLFEVDPVFFTELPEFLRSTDGCTEYGLQIFPQTFHTDGFFLTRLKHRKLF